MLTNKTPNLRNLFKFFSQIFFSYVINVSCKSFILCVSKKNVQAKGMQFLVFYIIKYYIHMEHFYYVQK